MEAWQATVQDEAGNAVFNPQITVYESDGVTLASIYNEDGSPKVNPFTGSLEGFAQFWAGPGVYKIRGANGGQTEVWEVNLGGSAVLNYADSGGLASSKVPDDVTVVYVGGSVYVADEDGALVSGDGRAWSNIEFSGMFERAVADMLQGDSMVITAYGDSTTDGNGTTGWTANPKDSSSDAIGTAPHTPPNAWPVTAQSVLRDMFRNNNITVNNAGYSGMQLRNGWANSNFQNAVLGPYPVPNIVIVSFGINDVRQTAFDPSDFETQLVILCRKIASVGAFPVFQLPDEPSDERHNGWLLGKVNGVYRSVSERLGVKIIDWGTAMNELSQCSDGTNWRWAADQPDDTHGNDSLHRIKGAFIAASIYPHTLWIEEDITDVAPWSKYCQPIDGYSVFQGTYNKFGGAMVVNGGSYATDQILLNMWVWSVGDARNMYWAAADANNYHSPRPISSAPRIEIRDYALASSSFTVATGSGAASQAGSTRDAEAMGLLGRLPQGISRWSFRAPRDNADTDVFLGYFSARKAVGAFNMAAPLFNAVTSNTFIDNDAGGDIPNVVGFKTDRELNLPIEASIPPGFGISLWSARCYGTHATRENNLKKGLFLFRNANNNAVYLYTRLFSADGSSPQSAVELGVASGISWSDVNRFRIHASVDGTQQRIRIYDGWTSDTPIIDGTNPLSNRPWPWGGTPGAVWQFTGYTGVAAIKMYGDI